MLQHGPQLTVLKTRCALKTVKDVLLSNSLFARTLFAPHGAIVSYLVFYLFIYLFDDFVGVFFHLAVFKLLFQYQLNVPLAGRLLRLAYS